MKKKSSKKSFKCNHKTEHEQPGEICDTCFDMILTDINDDVWGITKKLLDKYDSANVSAQMIMNTLLREGAFVASLMDLSCGEFARESVDVFGEVMMSMNDELADPEEEISKSEEEQVEQKAEAVFPVKPVSDKSLN